MPRPEAVWAALLHLKERIHQPTRGAGLGSGPVEATEVTRSPAGPRGRARARAAPRPAAREMRPAGCGEAAQKQARRKELPKALQHDRSSAGL